jgi:hypothetical protein
MPVHAIAKARGSQGAPHLYQAVQVYLSQVVETSDGLKIFMRVYANVDTRARALVKEQKISAITKFRSFVASGYKTDLIYTFPDPDAGILLSLQHDIQVQEQYLKELDNECAKDPSEFALLNSFTSKTALRLKQLYAGQSSKQNPHPERVVVLARLQTLLHTYSC